MMIVTKTKIIANLKLLKVYYGEKKKKEDEEKEDLKSNFEFCFTRGKKRSSPSGVNGDEVNRLELDEISPDVSCSFVYSEL